MAKTYIIGTKPVPEWCVDRLQPFRKTDGSTGVKFHGERFDIYLDVGDVLILKRNGYIEFQRRSGANACGAIS